ncbi:glycosyl-4,4'-diaponeurosporenoate acyltransferase CrtO family protein [Cyclobacterium plantarum]|uniref:Glycosyl-4,4'-diaponeurosporenoate acyltransferase n=1 Tax=Cyclobacterium plantarum TaxID=2716263 RepID=A0ABX0HH91_9BACT|nr:hypothetical protein [Cyclobacterium plantarum]NHE59987.1 hypothetical protein [Cyclobacterium plantarum]
MGRIGLKKYATVGITWLFVAAGIVGIASWQGLNTFVFAWVVNFLLMTALMAYTETLQPPLKSSYFDTKKWEKGGTVYRWLGVNGFRKLLVWIGWEKLNKAARPVKKDRSALEKLEYQTRQSEFGHLIIFILVAVLGFAVALLHGIRESFWLFFLNVVLNGYPMVVQRYNRPRLRGILSNQ